MLKTEKKCSNCYFGDKCWCLDFCDDYYPIDDLTDEEIDEMIEAGRREFLGEWKQYIEEYSD